MLRAFIAIQLSEELKGHISSVQDEVRRALASAGRGGRDGKACRIGWTHPDGIHLTLKFLGDIRESQIQPLQGVLRRAAASVKPFALEARGLGGFPNPRTPRVIWIGLHGSAEDSESLRRLQAEIEEGAAELGFQKEGRAFTPHLTLARVRDRPAEGLDKVLAANQDRVVGGFTAASVGLIKSELRPTGAIYTTLVEVPFGGGV